MGLFMSGQSTFFDEVFVAVRTFERLEIIMFSEMPSEAPVPAETLATACKICSALVKHSYVIDAIYSYKSLPAKGHKCGPLEDIEQGVFETQIFPRCKIRVLK